MNNPQFWDTVLGRVNYATRYRNLGVVSGGCVRDWFLGLPHNDIDVFVENFNPDNLQEFVQRIPADWGDPVLLTEERYEGAFQVLQYTVGGETVQVILLPGAFDSHMMTFDYSLVRAKYTLNGGLHLTTDFMYSLTRKHIFCTNSNDVPNTQRRMNEQRDKLIAAGEEGWQVEIVDRGLGN